LVAVAVMTCLTCPANSLGNSLHDRWNREASVRAPRMRIGTETDAMSRAFYQPWLAEEKGDQETARRVLDEALAQDARDGSLGTDRRFAPLLRARAEPGKPAAPSPSH
jgi:hypothetical protein